MTSSTPGSEFVTDTMALVLRLEGRKLGTVAKAAYVAAESGQATIFIPGIVFAEVLYLSEKHRISIGIPEVVNYFSRYPNCQEHPLTLAVVQAAAQITDIRELHDRLIAATARLLQKPLITNDPIIQASTAVRTIW